MTAGVARLFGEALLDLLLLPGRVVLALLLSRRRKAALLDLIRRKALDAPQDPHPAR